MKHTLVIFQCCKRKNSTEKFLEKDFDLDSRIPRTKKILHAAVKKFSNMGIIDVSSKPITALSRYDGHFYRTSGLKLKIAEEIKNGSYEFLIMSAGYGFVHPFQKIHDYEQQMKGKTTTYWLNKGLPKVLEEFIETGRYTRVYGFFSKSADYRKIFEKVNWHKIKELKEAGYFYIDGVRGASKVLNLSASLMLSLLNNNFERKPKSFKDSKIVFVNTTHLRIKMKKLAKDLLAHYRQNSFVCCGKIIEPRLNIETVFEPGTHGGIYDNDPSEWFPHYDVEYKCYNCRYYEHYTHDADGFILSLTINKVIFDFTTREFDIIENDKTIPAGRLPDDIEYNSEAFQEYFEKVLEKSHS